MNTNLIKIKCPHCGAEYLPAEIFMPGQLLGQTKNVIKDPLGKILYVDYKEDEEPEMTATFCCEHCDREFVAVAKLVVEAEEVEEELDFSNDTVSLLG